MNASEHPWVEVKEVRVEGLRFAYGERNVVEDVSFRIGVGELVAVVGPNGCGKSTLLRLMVGELRGSGRVMVDGLGTEAIGRLGMAQRIAMVPQQVAGGGGWGGGMGFTVRETVLMSRYAAHAEGARGFGQLAVMGFETVEDLRRADEAMWGSDVHHLVERAVETLSGGERQRVAIARAFAQGTGVMLLDEPTSSLDLYHQLELMAQLKHMAGKGGAGQIVVLVTHDLNLAREHATRVMVMDRGKLVADGKPGEVLVPGVLEGVYQVKVREEGGVLRFERGRT